MMVHSKKILALGLSLLFVGCGQPADFSLAAASENFNQNVKYNDEVDILWVVDDSETMGDHQSNLASQFDYFMDSLTRTKLNYQLSVISTDRGQYQGRILGNPKIITSRTPNPKVAFGNNVRLGTTGSPVERGLLSMKEALSPAKLAGDNLGFLRKDAQLVIIFLTDENDESADTTASYIQFLDQLKPNFPQGGKAWTAHFIGALSLSPECTSYGPHASPGTRYMDLVNYSKGVNESICTSDLSRALTSVQKRIVERATEYRLERDPILNTIVVRINGAVVPESSVNGWQYSSEGRAIRFYGTAIPGPDALIKVDYQPVGIKQ
ncbi:MAG: hypothetical protein AB7F59_14995 [Bdellovibrionales bacterium]